MMGKGTFDELYDSGVDFSALLKREEEEKEEDLKTSTSQVELMRSLSRSSRHINEMGSTLSLESVNLEYEVCVQNGETLVVHLAPRFYVGYSAKLLAVPTRADSTKPFMT